MIPVPDDPQERLDEVSELLAEAILRARLRRERRSNLRRRDAERNCLEVFRTTRTHACEPTSRKGERP